MVGLLTDSLHIDEEPNELKLPPSPAAATNFTVPNINDLDFSEPLFDSLPDFETLKDYWICQSPGVGIEDVMDMVGDESGLEVKHKASVGVGVANGCEGLSLEGQGVKVEVGQDGVFENMINGEHEGDEGLNFGGEGVGMEEVIGNEEGLKEVESEEKIELEVSGTLSPNIVVDLRNVSLDGQLDVSVPNNETGVKVEEKSDVAENGSRSESESESSSESESESSESSEASSSEDASSSDDEEDEEESDDDKDDEEQEVNVRRKAELEEGEIMDEDVEQMVAWSDDEEDVVKGPIRSKNEIADLPPVPKIDVTLNPNHLTVPVGVILSIVEKQVIVEGVDKHNPLNEGSILWITDTREPLGLVDDIFGPVKNPYYSIRYNNEDEVPSGISIGTAISFVPEFVNHVLNDASLYKKGYDASNENDEELSEELEFSDDEKEAEYRRMLKLSKRGSNDEAGGKRKKDKRKNKNQERNWNNLCPSPQTNSSEVAFFASNNSEHPSAPETPLSHGNQFSEGGPSFSFTHGMPAPFQQMNQPTNFNFGSNGVWPNGLPIQQQQQPMFFPNAFPTNGMPWMQQNNLVRNPFMSMNIPQGMPFPLQFGNNQMLPANLALAGLQQMFMGGSSNPPFPGFFGQNNFNQGNGQFMSMPLPGASITSIPSTEQNGVEQQQPPNISGHTDVPNHPSGRGSNPNSPWRGRSGGRGGRFNRGRG